MWKIDNIEINSKVVLAPMAGVTSFGYRKFMEKFGAEVTYTEMISDMGLIYGNDETNSYIDFPKHNSIIGAQLFGHDPSCLSQAAQIIIKKNKNIDFIDINMGCPVLKVTKTGAGSALLKDPKLCGDIVREIRKVTNLPITAKIRLGWDISSINYLSVINELEKAGISAIAIHARTKSELYTGLPHFNLLKDIRKQMHVPLIISGNIYTLDDAINAINITGADAVMVARGAMGNPFLIKQINTYFQTGERLSSPSLRVQLDYCLDLANYLIEEKGEKKAMSIYRSIAPKFIIGIPNAKEFKSRLASQLVDRKSLVDILNEIKENYCS